MAVLVLRNPLESGFQISQSTQKRMLFLISNIRYGEFGVLAEICVKLLKTWNFSWHEFHNPPIWLQIFFLSNPQSKMAASRIKLLWRGYSFGIIISRIGYLMSCWDLSIRLLQIWNFFYTGFISCFQKFDHYNVVLYPSKDTRYLWRVLLSRNSILFWVIWDVLQSFWVEDCWERNI
jgi:hypothetical protein